MTVKEMSNDRYRIAFDALLEGCIIPSKKARIFFDTCGKIIPAKCTLADFFKAVGNLTDEQLKRLYGDARLFRLQKKLTSKS